MKSTIVVVLVCSWLVCSCVNTPTAAANISPSASLVNTYNELNCQQLESEIKGQKRLEQEYAEAQEKRSSASLGRSAFYGWGTGDGIAAIELAKARSAIKALAQAIESKNCLATHKPDPKQN